MRQAAQSRIAFTRANAKKCLCTQCPVQSGSKCIDENSAKMGDVMTTRFFDPGIMPGLYCSSGQAACKDLIVNRSCICGACDVYNDSHLGDKPPLDHYCRDGSAR